MHYQKVVKPFIETPFIPTEVEKLSENSKKQINHDYSMSSAILVGPRSTNSGSEVSLNYIFFKKIKNKNLFYN
jgi:hypothetical protein